MTDTNRQTQRSERKHSVPRHREAKHPFQFFQLCRLTELTGEQAHTIRELRAGIARVPPACLFYHTHHAFLRAHRVENDFTNDFARWVADAVQAYRLAERLGGVDLLDYGDLEDLRSKFLALLDEDIAAHGPRIREAPPGESFHFIKGRTILYSLDVRARTLGELAAGVEAIPGDTIFFHFFEARLRLGQPTNDFSVWLETQLGESRLAAALERIDPYVLSLEQLRERLLEVLVPAVRAA